MVKKASAAKNKKEETVEEKIESLADESPKKESAPQVMQVVEVMDEDTTFPEKKEHSEEIPENEITHTEMVEPEVEITEPPKMAEAEKKEVVSEFFTKKPAMPTSGEPIAPSFGYPDISVHKKSPVAGVLLWAIGVIGVVVAIGAIIIATSRGSITMPTIGAKPTPTPTVAPMPTATPTPVVDKTTLNIQVLNGSGIAGEANKMKALLEEKGYTVEGTGNAKSYEYEQTEIQVTADNEAFINILTADLTGSYVVGSTAATLKSSLPYNAVVIVGKE